MKTRDFTFGVGILENDPAPEGELRTILQQWANSFRDDDFTKEASSKGVSARWVDCGTAAEHIDLLVNRLSKVLSQLKDL